MRPLHRGLAVAAVAAALTPFTFGQIEPVAFESFDYPVPGLLHLQNGGTGWGSPWFVNGAANDGIVMFDNSVMPAFPKSDGIGGHAGQAAAFQGGFRMLDVGAHPELVRPDGRFGADDTTMWVSFSIQNYQGMPFDHYGGFSFWQAGVGEAVFVGSPWNSNGWGIDDEGGGGAPEVIIPGTNDAAAACLVVRVDHFAGMDRLRMWVDPAESHPVGPPDLDEMIADLSWNEIRLESGGNNGDHYFFDRIVIEKGKPAIGDASCSAVPNSTGNRTQLDAYGSQVATDNDVCIVITDMPANAFGFVATSLSMQNVPMAGGGQGTLCIGPVIGRGVGGVIFNSGASGSATVIGDLTAWPTATGATSVMAGETHFVQAWHRDVVGGMATSNLSNGHGIPFQ